MTTPTDSTGNLLNFTAPATWAAGVVPYLASDYTPNIAAGHTIVIDQDLTAANGGKNLGAVTGAANGKLIANAAARRIEAASIADILLQSAGVGGDLVITTATYTNTTANNGLIPDKTMTLNGDLVNSGAGYGARLSTAAASLVVNGDLSNGGAGVGAYAEGAGALITINGDVSGGGSGRALRAGGAGSRITLAGGALTGTTTAADVVLVGAGADVVIGTALAPYSMARNVAGAGTNNLINITGAGATGTLYGDISFTGTALGNAISASTEAVVAHVGDIIGSCGADCDMLRAHDGASLTHTGVVASASVNGVAIFASAGSTVVQTGDVTTSQNGSGVHSYMGSELSGAHAGEAASVTVNGDVTGSGGGLLVVCGKGSAVEDDDSTVDVNGTVSNLATGKGLLSTAGTTTLDALFHSGAAGQAADVQSGDVTIGDLDLAGASALGVTLTGGTLTVTGKYSVRGANAGIDASGGGTMIWGADAYCELRDANPHSGHWPATIYAYSNVDLSGGENVFNSGGTTRLYVMRSGITISHTADADDSGELIVDTSRIARSDICI